LNLLRISCLGFVVLLLWPAFLHGQEERGQYPKFLWNAYFGLNVGSVNYRFSNQHLPAGYRAAEIHVPHVAPRVTLFGYRFNDKLSARVTYLRPVNWPAFADINGDRTNHSMWMNLGGLTLKARTPSRLRRPSFYAESGVGLITRKGFDIDGETVVGSGSYAGLLVGGGVEVPLNERWAIDANVTWAPGKHSLQQPHTLFAGSGFVYQMGRLPKERVDRNAGGGYAFPKHLVQAAITTDTAGLDANRFLSKGAVPVFWDGDVAVRRGLSVNVQRNLFHTRRTLSFDIGASVGYWESGQLRQRFGTVSVYPLLRLTAIRSALVDAYLNYSLAGPTLISRVNIDRSNTGRSFTFRDYMGIGVYAGPGKKWNAEVNIGHFSNGNLFPDNAGIKVPLTLYLGYAF
jgi:hypothetical protein